MYRAKSVNVVLGVSKEIKLSCINLKTIFKVCNVITQNTLGLGTTIYKNDLFREYNNAYVGGKSGLLLTNSL